MIPAMDTPTALAEPDAVPAPTHPSAADVQRLRLAIERAERIAAESELARQQAEHEHAVKVAEAMLADKPMPAKPAELSKLQAADDASACALELLRQRLVQVEGAHRTGEQAEAQAEHDAAWDDALKNSKRATVLLRDIAALIADCQYRDPVSWLHQAVQEIAVPILNRRQTGPFAVAVQAARTRANNAGADIATDHLRPFPVPGKIYEQAIAEEGAR
jgi:hypothetical protein